jgi:hypothetical protein
MVTVMAVNPVPVVPIVRRAVIITIRSVVPIRVIAVAIWIIAVPVTWIAEPNSN